VVRWWSSGTPRPPRSQQFDADRHLLDLVRDGWAVAVKLGERAARSPRGPVRLSTRHGLPGCPRSLRSYRTRGSVVAVCCLVTVIRGSSWRCRCGLWAILAARARGAVLAEACHPSGLRLVWTLDRERRGPSRGGTVGRRAHGHDRESPSRRSPGDASSGPRWRSTPPAGSTSTSPGSARRTTRWSAPGTASTTTGSHSSRPSTTRRTCSA